MTDLPEAKPIEVERLKRRPQFLFVRGGHAARKKTVVVQGRRRAAEGRVGAGFTATKKIGNSVVRNRAKRRMREAARALLPLHGQPGCDYVFIARMDTAAIAWPRLLDDMEAALITLAARLSDTGKAD
ncbi:MAG: ribonuclease P protein component [Pseudomonadota bacterium]